MKWNFNVIIMLCFAVKDLYHVGVDQSQCQYRYQPFFNQTADIELLLLALRQPSLSLALSRPLHILIGKLLRANQKLKLLSSEKSFLCGEAPACTDMSKVRKHRKMPRNCGKHLSSPNHD